MPLDRVNKSEKMNWGLKEYNHPVGTNGGKHAMALYNYKISLLGVWAIASAL
jgi:hypothetical protein